MPAELDNERAIYARTPAWHRLGTVNESGWFTAEEALRVINPNNEPIRKVPAFAFVDGKYVESEDDAAVVERDPDDPTKYRVLAFNSRDYGVVTLEDQFRFLDEVVGNLGGAHYEAAVRMRSGKQCCLTIDTGAANLDPNGRSDTIKKYIWGFNSFDRSWAFRVKMGNFRVECANLAAIALRESSDQIVSGDWSTRHTMNVMDRTWAAQETLGLYVSYNELWFQTAETMIQTELLDNTFQRLVENLFTNVETREKDDVAIEQTRVLYELAPGNANIYGTVWGGLQAVTEYADWYVPVRGSKKTSPKEMRFRKQMESPMKQNAWDTFSELVA